MLLSGHSNSANVPFHARRDGTVMETVYYTQISFFVLHRPVLHFVIERLNNVSLSIIWYAMTFRVLLAIRNCVQLGMSMDVKAGLIKGTKIYRFQKLAA